MTKFAKPSAPELTHSFGAALATVLIAAMLFAGTVLSGCAAPGQEAQGGAQPASPQTAQTQTDEAADADLGLVEDGALTVAASLDFPPFESAGKDNQATGFAVDLMGALAEKMGLTCEYLPTMKFDSIIGVIQTGGKADIGVSSFTVSPEREEQVDFTDPYCDSNQGVVVMASSGYESAADLTGLKIGAQAGTTGYEWAVENIEGADVIPFDEMTAVFAALQSGKIDGIVADLPVVQYYVKTAYTDCSIIQEIPTGEQYAVAVSKDNPALLAALNEALAETKADGTYDAIHEKWFGAGDDSEANGINAGEAGGGDTNGANDGEAGDANDASAQHGTLEVTSCTAKPNQDGTGAIMGATPTRVTWEAQTASGAGLSSITLTLPEGTQFSPENTQVTALDGLDRISVPFEASADGGNLTVAFPEATPAGLLIRVEMHDVSFPADGGTFTIPSICIDTDGVQTDAVAPGSISITGISTAERISQWLGAQPWVQAWNSNSFLHLFLDPTIMAVSIPQVAKGWLTALALVLAGIPMAVPLGFLAALLRMSKFRIARAVASVYVNIVRGTPMFLQIYIAFFGLPLLGIALDNFVLGAVVMAINSGAYLCEIFRAGIQSISKGQFEAARSLGMNAAQTMIHVIIPQAFRRVIPTVTNEFILLYKDTSLLAAVGLSETVMFAKIITANTGNITPYIVAAMFYLIVTLPMSAWTRSMEEKSANRHVAHAKKTGKTPRPGKDSGKKSWTPDTEAARDVLAIKTADL